MSLAFDKEDKNFQLQAQISLKEEEIERLEAEKAICIEKQQAAETERAQGQSSKNKTLIMFLCIFINK